MGSKQASIVVDLRTGKNVIHVPDLIAILSAAGYKPDVALKAYGGETLNLARKAARETKFIGQSPLGPIARIS